MQTRKGTRVLNPAASALAIIAEIYHDAAEYECYRYFRVGDADAPRFSAEPPDRLLVHDAEDMSRHGIAPHAHVLNLVTGQKAIIPWDALAHTCKPAEPRA